MRKKTDIRLTAAAFILTLAAIADAQSAVNAVNANAVNAVVNTNTVDTNIVDTNTVNTVNANIVDTVNANTVDTIAINTNINAVDTVDTVNTVNAANVIKKDSSAAGKRPPPPLKPDAEPPQLSGAYWGFGIGLSVGNVPVFPMWQKSFPDSPEAFGLSPAFAADAGSGDTAQLRYRVIETPDAFNFAVPFRLSLYSVGEKSVLSFAVSFFRNSKEFQSALEITDGGARKINILERLSYYSVSIEAAGSWAIPPVFFSVDGAQQTYLSLALGLSPINTFTRECEIETDFNGGDARMLAVADSVRKTFAALSGNGLSLSWRIGISSVKRYPSGYGAELGLYYSGSYSGNFYSDGVRLTEDHIKTRGSDLSAENAAGGKPLSFLSNQAEFRITLLAPAKKRD